MIMKRYSVRVIIRSKIQDDRKECLKLLQGEY